MNLNTYWGDLHSHCSISYGHGTLEQALKRASQQLDFCSVTGHAFWPDMPTDRNIYSNIIDYHNDGFATLAHNWDELLRLHKSFSKEGSFVAIPSYEWHSLKYGDHNIYAPSFETPLTDAVDLPAMRQVAHQSRAIAIPHHIGYRAGYRGINWEHYSEECSPFVEIYSLHGCSVSDDDPFPMLHDMGPRDHGSTAEAGWQKGHRFGIVGGTDHHGAYPGSHGDGRMGIFAKDLSMSSIWDAFINRRVYAATGDRIDARLYLNDAFVGDSIKAPEARNLKIDVKGLHRLDKVELVKNGKTIQRFFPESENTSGKHRLSITWGWGKKDMLVKWDAKLSLSEGTINSVNSRFSGQAIVAPKGEEEEGENPDSVDLPHEITEQNDRSICWKSMTMGNITMRHATTQGLSLEIDAPLHAKVTVEVNGQTFSYKIGELVGKAHSHFMRGWLTEAIQIGSAVPLSECHLNTEFKDTPDNEVDYYRLRIAQSNGDYAWLTPIWAER